MGGGVSKPKVVKDITYYLRACPLSVVMDDQTLVDFSSCFELVVVPPESSVKALDMESLGNLGDFFIVAEGYVDVSVKVPSQKNKKAGYLREVLCTKKGGDMLWVPAVEKYAEATAVKEHSKDVKAEAEDQKKNKARGGASFLRRMSVSLGFGMHSRPAGPAGNTLAMGRSASAEDDTGGSDENFDTPSRRKMSVMTLMKDADSNEKFNAGGSAKSHQPLAVRVAATEGKTLDRQPTVVKQDSAELSRKLSDREAPKVNDQNIKKVMKQMDMTTVTAPMGATLLHLDRKKFALFEERHSDDFKSTRSAKFALGSMAEGNEDEEEDSEEEEKQPEEPAPMTPPRNIDFLLLRAMMKSNIQDYLKRIPFLSKVSTSRLEMLGKMSNFELFRSGHTICEEGEEGEKVYVMIFGTVSVYSQSSLPDPKTGRKSSVLLTDLSIGDHFGELSVLANIPRQATCKSKTPCLMISIDRPSFKNLMKVVPDIGETVESVMKLYMLSKFFRSLLYSESLTNINQDTLEVGLLPTCSLFEAPANEVLVKQDSLSENFYFLYHGKVHATKKNSDGTEETVAYLNAGHYFGDISILTHKPCTATLTTDTRCMMLKVTKVDFLNSWCKVPGFRAEFLIRTLGEHCHLEHILEHDVAKKAFSDFLDAEYASENIHFYEAAGQFFSTYLNKSDSGNLTECQKIYERYLKVGCDEQVNISSRMLKNIEQTLKTGKVPGMVGRFPPRTLFDEARVEAYHLMEKDNFKRFIHSEAFSALLGKIRYMEALETDREQFEKTAGNNHTAGSFGSFRQFDSFVNKEIKDCESDDEEDIIGSRSGRRSGKLKQSVSLVPEESERAPSYEEAVKKATKVPNIDVETGTVGEKPGGVITPKAYNSVTGWNPGAKQTTAHDGTAGHLSPGDGSRNIMDEIS